VLAGIVPTASQRTARLAALRPSLTPFRLSSGQLNPSLQVATLIAMQAAL